MWIFLQQNSTDVSIDNFGLVSLLFKHNNFKGLDEMFYFYHNIFHIKNFLVTYFTQCQRNKSALVFFCGIWEKLIMFVGILPVVWDTSWQSQDNSACRFIKWSLADTGVTNGVWGFEWMRWEIEVDDTCIWIFVRINSLSLLYSLSFVRYLTAYWV